MRGEDERSEDLFSFVRLEQRVPADHPLRAIRALVDEALGQLSRSFARLYARDGRPSSAPERLLRALLLQAFFTVRSERQLMEQLDYNLLFRWFVGLSMDEAVWDATVFCKNRDRLLDGDIARKFMAGVLSLPQVRKLLSSEHFSVDGTLIEAWASMKSFVPKGAPSDQDPGTRRRRPGTQRRARFSWREAVERDPCLDDRPRRPPVSQKQGQGGQALPHGAYLHGEPPRAHRRGAAERGQRHRRAHDGSRHDQGQGRPRQHGWRRHELRHRRLRRRLPHARMHAARRAEHDQPPYGDR